MKTLLKLGAVVIVLLLALTACTYNELSVQWSITSWTIGNTTTFTTITYDVWNDGKYDLTGINLLFSVYSPSGYLYVKTPNFSLSQGQAITAQIVVNVAPDLASQVSAVEIVGVDMDKPKD
jgi:hypothetical protein